MSCNKVIVLKDSKSLFSREETEKISVIKPNETLKIRAIYYKRFLRDFISTYKLLSRFRLLQFKVNVKSVFLDRSLRAELGEVRFTERTSNNAGFVMSNVYKLVCSQFLP